MYSDSHVHTRFSGDSETSVRAQIEAAVALGMTELCITDHHDFDVDSGDIDFNLDVDSYLLTLNRYREQYRDQIQLLIGIEFGQQPHLTDYECNFFDKYHFDFIIGSTHFVDGKDPYYPDFFDGRTEAEAYSRYFEVLADNLERFEHYNTAAHLDYVVRYGPNRNKFFSYNSYQDYLDPILRTLVAKGKGLECNTGGLYQGLGQTNPHPDIIKRYLELGGEIITLGSDAHISKNVGYGLETAGEMLKGLGCSYYATFINQKPVFHKL